MAERVGVGAKGVRRHGGLLREERAQGTLEYALTVAAILAIAVGCAALWRASEDGTLARLAEEAASHGLSGLGPLDIALY